MADFYEKGRLKSEERAAEIAGTWAAKAELVLKRIAYKSMWLTTDDLWAEMRKQYPGLEPKHPTAAGTLMVKASRDGIIVKTQRTRPSMNRVCHGRDKRVWQSLIHPHSQANV